MKKFYTVMAFAIFSLCFTKVAKSACTANFTSSNIANVFNFTDASTSTSGSIVSWLWNFGDLSAPSTLQNPTHTYTVCGVYNVSLTIGTSLFCTNTYSTTITVNSGMTGSFTSTVDTTTGTAAFTGSPLGLDIDYAWDFGDGNTGIGAVANNTYATSGTYYVCLTVSDTGGICTNTFCDSVVVYISIPSCGSTFTYTDNGTGNLTFQAAPVVVTNTYSWDYGDGTMGTLPFSLHTYATAGTYYVCLTTTDPLTSCTSTYCDTVIAAGTGGICSVSYTYLDVNGVVGFNATPTSITNTYTWNFGDGNSGANAATANIYATEGTYYVCVTMLDAFNSCSDTYCDSVVVNITGIGILENETNNFNFVVFPNPANEQVTVSYELSNASQINIEIFDLIGNKISKNLISQTSGKYQSIINIEHLSQGAYFIKLSSENGNSSKLIIKK